MHNYICFEYVLYSMVRPKKVIPLEDLKGLRTLLQEGKTQKEIAEYYGVTQPTISRLINGIGNNV